MLQLSDTTAGFPAGNTFEPIKFKCVQLHVIQWNTSPGLFLGAHRAMFKLGAKIVFLLCLLVKNISAVYSADRCYSEEPDYAVQDLYGIGGDISAERAPKPENFGHFRFPIPVPNWQFWIKV